MDKGGIVVDASVLADAILGENQPYVQTLFRFVQTDRGEFHAPTLIADEVLNALLKARQGNRIDADEFRERFQTLQSILTNIRLYPHAGDNAALSRKERLASKHTLRSYDANYLLLAQEISASLATLDSRLKRAAQNEGLFYEAK